MSPSAPFALPALALIGVLVAAPAAASAAEPEWSPSTVIASGAPKSGGVAVALEGDALIALWSSPTGSALTSTSLDAGATWTEEQLLGRENYGADGPMLVSTGTSTVAGWVPNENTSTRIESSTTVDTGATWSPWSLISAYGGIVPAALLASDDLVVSGWRQGSSLVGVNVSRDAGATWSLPITVVATPEVVEADFAVAGEVVAASWSRFLDFGSVVEASVSVDGGLTWSTPQMLADSASVAYRPNVAVDANGTVVVAWDQQSGTDVLAARTDDGGATWSAATSVASQPSLALEMRLVATSVGFVAVWNEVVDGVYVLRQALSQDGGLTWSDATTIAGPSPSFISASVDADGDTVVATWTEVANPELSLFTLRSSVSHDGGLSWGATTELWPDAASGAANVAIDGTRVVVAATFSTEGGAVEHRMRSIGLAQAPTDPTDPIDPTNPTDPIDPTDPAAPQPELAESGAADLTLPLTLAAAALLGGLLLMLRSRRSQQQR